MTQREKLIRCCNCLRKEFNLGEDWYAKKACASCKESNALKVAEQKQRQEEAALKKTQEEAAQKKAKEAALKKAQEEAAQEKARKKAQEEAALKKAREEAAQKEAEEAVAQRKAQEEAEEAVAKKKAQAEAAQRKVEQEAAQKKAYEAAQRVARINSAGKVRAWLKEDVDLTDEQADEITYLVTDPKWGVMSLPMLFALDEDDIVECFKPVEPYALRKLVFKAITVNRA